MAYFQRARSWLRSHSRRFRHLKTGAATFGTLTAMTALSFTLSPINVMADYDKKSRQTILNRYNTVKGDYRITVDHLRRIQCAFVNEMEIGLKEADDLPREQRKSSLKMLSSKVHHIPTGSEKGVFYTLDWGGSNYRVLRLELRGRGRRPLTSERKVVIRDQFKTAKKAEELFDYLSSYLWQEMTENMELRQQHLYPVGFTFSFPMHQPALNQGVLLTWTKGFDIPGVVGNDVGQLMHEAFDRLNINARVHAVCNDTVGTLLACAYDFENVRVGLILGTGTNAAYYDPDVDEIINTEWGNFDKLLPRMEATDIAMDDYTPDPGRQFTEKMMSGYYLGELVRLLAIDIFGEKITSLGDNHPMKQRWAFKSEAVSAVLKEWYSGDIDAILEILRDEHCALSHFEKHDAMIFAKICRLIANRSADLAAALLLGTLQKTGLFSWDEENDIFELTEEYKADKFKNVTIGIDGSVFKYVPKYKQTMEQTMNEIVGHGISSRINLVHSADGSGKGAALAVAAAMHGQSQK